MNIQIPRNGSKIGFSNNVGIGNFVILSNASVVDPTGEQIRIASTSSSDSSEGSGIQKVRIAYFDTKWTLNEEIITMPTLPDTYVDTVAGNIFRIESFEAFQTGSNLFSVGNVTAKSLDGLSLFAQIDSNNTIFKRSLHFVSPGKVGAITDIIAHCPSSAGAEFLVFTTKDNTSGGGGTVIIPDMAFVLNAGTSSLSSLYALIVCDATKSTQGLQMGILVKGLAANQIAMASFKYQET